MRPLRPTTMLAGMLACLAAAASGCQQQPRQRGGDISVRFRDAGAGVLTGPAFSEHLPIDVLIPARPREPMTVPARAAGVGVGAAQPVIAVVRATIDRDGRVADVKGPGEIFPPPNAAEHAFQAAAEKAVAGWAFDPAELRRLACGQDNDGRRYWIIKWRERAACRVELTFQVSPQGDVTWTLEPIDDQAPKRP